MSHGQLPVIGQTGKKTAKSPLTSLAPQRLHHATYRQRRQHQKSSSLCHLGPSIPASDTSMSPWGGLALSELSFASIGLPPSPPPSPSTPYENQTKDEKDEKVNSQPFQPLTGPTDSTAFSTDRECQNKQRQVAQYQTSHTTHLPPLRPITNLSFSRSFTFSFFELPLHQSPQFRAERFKNLMLLSKQVQY